MKRTTILAEERLLLDAKLLGRRLGKSFTDVVREALAEYVATHGQKERRFSIEGIGNSGGAAPGDNRDLAERLDELLRSGVEPMGGWSPPRQGAPSSDRRLSGRRRARGS